MMIQLELTHDDFLFVLKVLLENIQHLEISDETLDKRVENLRQYNSEELIHLLNGLRNGDLGKSSSEWLQAIQYVYNNQEIEFIEVQVLEQEEIRNKIQKLLIPSDAIVKRFSSLSNKLVLLSLIVFSLVFFVFYGFTWWWKAPLYTLASVFLVLLLLLVADHFVVVTNVLSIRRSFFKLFPKDEPNYYKAVTILKKQAISRYNIEERLYKSLNAETETSSILLGQSKIEEKIKGILVPLTISTNLLEWLLPKLLGLTLFIVILYFFLFYYTTIGESVCYSTLILASSILILNIGGYITAKVVIYRTRNSFSKLFAKSYSSYYNALKILKSQKDKNRSASILYDSLKKKEIDGQNHIFLNDEAIKNKILQILNSFDATLNYLSSFWFLGGLVCIGLTVAILYCFVSYNFIVYLAVLIAVLIVLIILSSNAVTIAKRLACNSFLEIFPKNHPNYPKALEILAERESSRMEQKKFYQLLIIETKETEWFLKFQRVRQLWTIGSIIIVLEISMLYNLAWWQITIYSFLIYLVVRLLIEIITAQDKSTSVEDRYIAIKMFAKSDWLLWRIFLGNRRKGLQFFNQGKYSQAQKPLEIAIGTLLVLIEKNDPSLRPLLAETYMLLGQSLFATGDHNVAKKMLEKSLEEFEKANKGILTSNKERITEEIVEIETKEQLKLRENIARICVPLALCFVMLKDLSKAQEMSEKSIDEYKKLIGVKSTVLDHHELVLGLSLAQVALFNCLDNLGELSDSNLTDYLEKSLDECQSLLGGEKNHLSAIDRASTAQILVAFGYCFSRIRNLPKAVEKLEDGIEKYQCLINEGHSEWQQELLNARVTLGFCLIEQGDFTRASKVLSDGLGGN